MPTTEIDFSQCRRCTPSYRALPHNYPRGKCSGRTALCESVLNNNWVSVPTGSEDFGVKNLRRNQYEEALFKCEDDRYEIDMVMDANRSTIRALEPIAKNIADLDAAKSSDASSASTEPGKYQYRLDKRALTVMHLLQECTAMQVIVFLNYCVKIQLVPYQSFWLD
jgi:paired amphipathic helix protein Sin3a